MSTARIVTKEEFEGFPARVKGYVVYMLGGMKDQPNIPMRYTPAQDDRQEYEAGQMEAVLEAQEGDD